MTDTETELRFSQPRSTFGTWIGVVLLFAIFAIFVWAVMGMMPRGDDYEKKRAETRMENLKKYHDEIDPQLKGYAYVDKAKGTVRIPIDKAMQVALSDLANKKPAPANPIAPETAQPGAQASAPTNATPAPGASAGASPKPTPHTAIEGKNSENEGQAAGSANPPNAAPGTQPGPNSTPAAAPVSDATQPQPGLGKPTATPVQSPAGSPLPVPGATPK